MLFHPRLSITLVLLLLNLPLLPAEAPRTFPLWDVKEAVASYAQRVNLPATKSIDLGGGVALELVLIPAGQFIMGSEEPAKPTVMVADTDRLVQLGLVTTALLLLLLAIQCIRKRKLSFSLFFLLLLTITAGILVGGIARRRLAIYEFAQYEMKCREYYSLPSKEKPAHTVTITKPFYLGKFTITQEQYSAIMGNNPSHFKGARLPVETVSWNDATAFCKKLNELLKNESLEARLPTEAQWEFACRAGTRTRFYSGDLDSDLNAAGWCDSNSGLTAHPVGQLKANAFGLYDMHGNVWQWCQDNYDEYHLSTNTIQNPGGPTGKPERVLRGGFWNERPDYCRSASRGNLTPDRRSVSAGFRVVVKSLDQ